MPVDTQGKDATWWAQQYQNLRDETDRANKKMDQMAADHKKALTDKDTEKQKALTELGDNHKKEIERLKAVQEQVNLALVAEPKEARDLRLQQQKEAGELNKKHIAEKIALVQSLKK